MLLKIIRKLAIICTFALLANVLTAQLQLISAAETDLKEVRSDFKKALKAQRLGRYNQAKSLIAKHQTHPLYGYVKYYDIRRRLARYPSEEINSFLKAEGNSRIGRKLRKSWLIRLHKGRRWKEFVDIYRNQPFTEIEMRCRNFEAKVKIGQGISVLADIKSTWLSGTSLPKQCDPAFLFLYSGNHLEDDLVWERIKMAHAKNNTSLANYLARYLEERRLIKLHGNWQIARRSPNRFLKKQNLTDTSESRDILAYSLTRLSRSDFESAIKMWNKISKKFRFLPEEQSVVMAALGVAGAAKQDRRALKFLDLVDEKFITRKVELNRLSLGIVLKAWPELVKWTDKDAPSDISSSRWQYWRAFALNEVGRSTESRLLLTGIAKRRDYHGFLAADMLGTAYQFNNNPIAVNREEIDHLIKKSNYNRANELLLIGRKLEAKREFFHELGRSSNRELEIAAKLAEVWEWPKGSIFALGKASSYNDLALRFPLGFTDKIREELAPKTKYVVKRGDSLWRISNKFGLSISQLRKWNNLRKNSILHPGQRLVVKDKSDSTMSKVGVAYYKVRQGDSLWKISRKFDVSMRELRDWNHMRSGHFLKIGQRLRVGRKKDRKFKLSVPGVLAIIRAESAFDPYARSVANARGLMQIIPSTARLTARRHGIRLRRIKDLYQPEKSIAIGTAYLTDMLNDFNGNFAMAAAAYNAGPHRVKRWQKKRCGDPRMWIDSIPITETRRYVRRAIFYSRIYEWRLGLPVKKIENEIGMIPQHFNKLKTKECWL